MLKTSFAIAVTIALAAPVQPALAQAGRQKAPNPDEKICEIITPVGSRLGTKKVCATRAQWDAKRKRDREMADEAQRRPCFQAESSTGVGGLVCG